MEKDKEKSPYKIGRWPIKVLSLENKTVRVHE